MHETGRVKILDFLRGFGFITPDKGREVFFHVSDCVDRQISLAVELVAWFDFGSSVKEKSGVLSK